MKVLSLAAASALALVSLTGCTPTPADTYLYACVHYVQQPAEYTPYCADLGQDFTKISWSSWAETEAVGNATVETNLCDPTCSTGKSVETTATITLSKPVKKFLKMVYSQMEVHYETVPAGHHQDEVLSIIVENPYNTN